MVWGKTKWSEKVLISYERGKNAESILLEIEIHGEQNLHAAQLSPNSSIFGVDLKGLFIWNTNNPITGDDVLGMDLKHRFQIISTTVETFSCMSIFLFLAGFSI